MAGRKDIVDLALKMVMGEGSDAAKAGIRAYHGTPQPTENLIDLFHGTTPEAFDAITSSGDIFGSSRFSPRRDVAETFAHNVGGNANTVVKVKAPASSLMVDLDLPAAKLLTPDEAAAYLDKPDWTILDFIENGYSVGVPDTSVLSIERASGGSIREGYQTKGRVVGDIVDQALKLVMGVGEQAAPVSRIGMNYKDVTKRVPELTEAAKRLQSGEIGQSEYSAMVDRFKPVEPYASVPNPASVEDMVRALTANKREKIGKLADYPEGHPVALRLDIPAYTAHGVWVPTIHDQKTFKSISHEPAAHITGAQFSIPENKALAVAAGGAKGPFATIDGSLLKTPPEAIHERAKAAMNDPDWVQVGMDPERHSYFYDRKTMQPVISAEEVIQVGPLVLARKPVYGNAEGFKYSKGGSIREGYGPGGWVDDVVKMAGKVIEGEGDNVTRLSDVKSARARDALIKQLKSSINQVKSGYFQAGRQALINQKSMDLHKSGMLPLQQGTIVNPPSTWDMPGDWRVSGYWYDEKDPRRFGYRLQNESGQTYDAAASDPRAGLKRDNPYSFGAGFKAYAGPNAAPPKPVASPVEKPAATPKPPEVLDAINKEYEGLFGSEDPFKPRAHGGRIAKGPGGWLDDVVKMAGKVISGEGEDAAKTGIRAYQGSPHNFAAERLVRFPEGRTEYLVGQPDVLPDVPEGAEVLQDFPLGRMRMDKIGTGEGAQAYGHGLYLAEHEPVAQGYKDALRRKGDEITFDNMPLKEPRDYNAIQSQLENQEGDWRLFKAVDEITTRQGSMEDRLGDIRNWYRNQPEMLAAIDRAEKRMTLKENPGFVYETNINADPNTFLDWDKPLSEQPEAVRKLFPSVEEAKLLDAQMEKLSVDVLANPNNKDLQAAWDAAYRSPKHRMASVVLNEANPKLGGKFASGDKAYSAIAEKPSEASALLKEAGIPGIKFFDAGSRAAGEGTRNYVVFDDKLISIIRKYGIAGASAMLGYNLMEQLDPKQALAASMADQDYQASRPQKSMGGNNSISGALNVARGLNGGE